MRRQGRLIRGRSAGLAGVLAALLFPRPSWADPKDDARRHFLAGLEAARSEDFERSLAEFLAAQDAYPHPATLYNIARAYTDLGQLEKALEYYELYRDAAPEKAEDVEPTIRVIEARLRRQLEPAPAPEAVPGAATMAAASSEEVERLRQIAGELAELSDALAQRAVEPAPVPSPGPLPATAAEPPVPEEPLPDAGALMMEAYERVVVTASRYGQDPLDSPSTVTILTDQDIRMSGATNVPDLLRRVVGVEVMQLSAAQPDVSIRGFNRELSNKVLVLIDGRSVYLDLLGTVIWATLPISLDEIERIEIIRGPGSAIYGANAVTGVVNIITRTPGTGQNLVHVDAGGPGYIQGTALATGRSGSTAYRLSAGYHQTGRWSAEAPVEPDGPLVPLLDDQDLSMQVARAHGRIDRDFGGRLFASLSGGYVEGTTEFYVFGALGDYGMPFKSGYGRADLSYAGFHLRGFFNTLVGTAGPWAEYEGARSLVAEVDSDTYDVELETLQEFSTGPVEHRLNLGLGYRFKRIEWGYLNDEDDLDEAIYSGFFQEEARIDRVSLVGSLRFDKTELVPLANTISPRGAAIVRVARRTAARVTGGTSFRAPTQMESYLDLNQLTDFDGVYISTLGNKDLKPERIFTAEAGLHDESSSWLRADVAAYFNRVDRFIFVSDVGGSYGEFSRDDNGYSAGTVSFENLEPYYDALGIELDGQVFPMDGLDVYANVDLQRIVETAPATDEAPSTTELDKSTSALKVNVGAMYRSPWRVDLAAHYHYVSPQTWRLREYDESGTLQTVPADVDARHIVSARLAARPFPREALELAVSAWNIGALVGDPFREHPKGQLVDGRLFGTVAYRF